MSITIPSEAVAGDVLILIPEGRLDSGNAADAEADVLRHLDEGRSRIVLDLGGLDYISSAGLRLVLVAAKRLKQANGKLALCALRPHVREVFDISGFATILTIVETRNEAEAAVAG